MPGPHKRPPLSIRLPEADEARLRDYAGKTGQPVNQVVTAAVREKLDREEPSAADPATTGAIGGNRG